MKKSVLILVLLTMVLVIAACSGNNSDNGNDNATDNSSNDNGNTAETASLDLTASNFDFDKDTYTVQAGEEVSMSLKDEEGMHGAAIDEFDVDISDGEGATFTPTEPGEYEIYCSIPCGEGHDDMTATLVVE